jgi:hypothetical protein
MRFSIFYKENVRIIKHFHPSGKNIPDAVYYHKGEWLKECTTNNNKFSNCFNEKTNIYSINGNIIEGIQKATSIKNRLLKDKKLIYDFN